MMMMYLWDISNYEKGKIKNWKREREDPDKDEERQDGQTDK